MKKASTSAADGGGADGDDNDQDADADVDVALGDVAHAAGVDDDDNEPIEIQTEADGTLLLTSITAHFPDVTGLKFRHATTGTARGVRCHNGVLHPPSEDGWGKIVYFCVKPKVRIPVVQYFWYVMTAAGKMSIGVAGERQRRLEEKIG